MARAVEAVPACVKGIPTAVLADDHPAIRLGVRMALMADGMRVLAEAGDRDEAVRAVLRERPDVCVLDVYMPGGGIQAAAAILAATKRTAVVMLTVSTSTDDLLAALRAGAMGYLPKDMSPERLAAALRGVLAGEPALPRALVGPVLDKLRGRPEPEAGTIGLTTREVEVMRLLRSGLPTAEIGRSLSLSPVTVRRHISAAVGKLGVANREEAVRAF